MNICMPESLAEICKEKVKQNCLNNLIPFEHLLIKPFKVCIDEDLISSLRWKNEENANHIVECFLELNKNCKLNERELRLLSRAMAGDDFDEKLNSIHLGLEQKFKIKFEAAKEHIWDFADVFYSCHNIDIGPEKYIQDFEERLSGTKFEDWSKLNYLTDEQHNEIDELIYWHDNSIW